MKFQSECDQFNEDGLTINESMTVRIAADGSYEVEFTAESLAIPVTVWLQVEVLFEGKRGTITLPTLVLDGRRYNRSDDDSVRWHVVHRGTSSFLQQAFARSGIPIEIRRSGAAQFGSGVSASAPPEE